MKQIVLEGQRETNVLILVMVTVRREHIIEAKTAFTGEDFCLQMLFSQSDYVLCSIGLETRCPPLLRLLCWDHYLRPTGFAFTLIEQ